MTQAKSPLTPRGRRLLVDRILVDGWPVAHAAAMAGVSRQTAHKWLVRFREEGPAGLEDRPSRARRCPHKTSPEIEASVLRLRAELRRGPHRLANRLHMAPSTVHAILARHGLSRLSRLDRTTGQLIRRETPLRYERERAGELVHIDVKKLGRVPEGGGWRGRGEVASLHVTGRGGAGYDYLHVAVDDRSRFAYLEVHADEKGITCAGFLERCRAHFASLGVSVQAIMTDNAKNYVVSKDFRAALEGLAHLRTRPRRPQTNGKAERFIQSALREWAYGIPYHHSSEREAMLDRWTHHYNWHRPHQGIAGLAPISRLAQSRNNLLTLHS